MVTSIKSNNGGDNMTKIKTIIFDISGVLVDARSEFCRKIDVSMEYAGLCEYDFSFEELLVAFGRDAFPEVFKKKIKDKKILKQREEDFYSTWGKIPEFYPGNIKMYDDVIPTLHWFLKQGFSVVFASRLASQYCEILMEALKKKGLEETEKIKIFNPMPEERFLPNCMDFVFKRVMDNTEPLRVYIDDSINRMDVIKKFDPKILCIGSTCGFFGEFALRNSGADKVINNLSQLVQIMR